MERAGARAFSRYGLLLDRLAMGVVNGFTYHQPQPFDMPGPDGPMSPDELNAEFGRRLGVAAEMWETKLWRQDLADWDNEWKPDAIARHRQLADVSLAELDDAALSEHLATAAAHVSEMVLSAPPFQHGCDSSRRRSCSAGQRFHGPTATHLAQPARRVFTDLLGAARRDASRRRRHQRE